MQNVGPSILSFVWNYMLHFLVCIYMKIVGLNFDWHGQWLNYTDYYTFYSFIHSFDGTPSSYSPFLFIRVCVRQWHVHGREREGDRNNMYFVFLSVGKSFYLFSCFCHARSLSNKQRTDEIADEHQHQHTNVIINNYQTLFFSSFMATTTKMWFSHG